MAQFSYKARDGRGELLNGLVQADSIDQASRMLRSEGKFIVKLTEATAKEEKGTSAPKPAGTRRIKRAEVITFAHQIAVMIDTGVPITEALECISEQAENPAFRAVLQDVTRRVQSGGELSTALSAYPKVFPVIMTSLIRASEASGTMGTMLDRISSYLEKESQTAKKIKGALIYPAVMFFMVLAVTVFLLTFVLPRFAGIYESKSATLPLPTRMLMSLSDMMIGYWWAWLGGLVVVVVTLMFTLRTHLGRRVLDYVKLHSPVFGSLFTKLYITRGCRTMGTMIAAGVPILDMIAIVKQITCNSWYEDLWDEVDQRLRQGSQLSDALFTSPLIPHSVAQMIYSGEKAGRLGSVMERIAQFTEQEFDNQVKSTTQLIEPIMVVVMGSIIGFVAIALLLPIFSIGSVMAGK